MAELLLKDKLRTARNKEVRNVARTQTLTVLRGLDAVRKGLVLRFLYEAGLIWIEKPIVNMESADLRGADLRYVNLHGAILSYVNLHGTDLSHAHLDGAILSNLLYSSLFEGSIFGPGANLPDANLELAFLLHADLRGANLTAANLNRTFLTGANLTDADLSGANLSHTTLTGANLRDAKVTSKQLATAQSLYGATMPDGTKQTR